MGWFNKRKVRPFVVALGESIKFFPSQWTVSAKATHVSGVAIYFRDIRFKDIEVDLYAVEGEYLQDILDNHKISLIESALKTHA